MASASSFYKNFESSVAVFYLFYFFIFWVLIINICQSCQSVSFLEISVTMILKFVYFFWCGFWNGNQAMTLLWGWQNGLIEGPFLFNQFEHVVSEWQPSHDSVVGIAKWIHRRTFLQGFL